MANLNIAVVCSSNMNRSMEAHSVLSKRNFKISSYGTGEKVKIPGKSPWEPNVYPFGTTYEEIYRDLVKKDKKIYKENGMLHILDRNMRIKSKPEKFQESKNRYDLIFTCEEKVYDQVVESFESAGSSSAHPVHIINIDIIDNPEDATIGAFMMRDLVTKFSESEDLDDDIDEILHDFESSTDRQFLHSVIFY